MALQGHAQEEVRKEDRGGQVLVSFFLFFSLFFCWGGGGGGGPGVGVYPKTYVFVRSL